MKFYCRRCSNEVNLKEDRIEGRYVYVCSNCETPQKKADMITEAQKERMNAREFEPIYHCDSCDKPIWTKEELDACDSCGRCEECQEEYGELEEF